MAIKSAIVKFLYRQFNQNDRFEFRFVSPKILRADQVISVGTSLRKMPGGLDLPSGIVCAHKNRQVALNSTNSTHVGRPDGYLVATFVMHFEFQYDSKANSHRMSNADTPKEDYPRAIFRGPPLVNLDVRYPLRAWVSSATTHSFTVVVDYGESSLTRTTDTPRQDFECGFHISGRFVPQTRRERFFEHLARFGLITAFVGTFWAVVKFIWENAHFGLVAIVIPAAIIHWLLFHDDGGVL